MNLNIAKIFLVTIFLLGDLTIGSAQAQFIGGPGFFFGPRHRAVPIGPQPRVSSYRSSKRKYVAQRSYNRGRSYSRGGSGYSYQGYPSRSYNSGNPLGLSGQQPASAPCIPYQMNVDGSKYC